MVSHLQTNPAWLTINDGRLQLLRLLCGKPILLAQLRRSIMGLTDVEGSEQEKRREREIG